VTCVCVWMGWGQVCVCEGVCACECMYVCRKIRGDCRRSSQIRIFYKSISPSLPRSPLLWYPIEVPHPSYHLTHQLSHLPSESIIFRFLVLRNSSSISFALRFCAVSGLTRLSNSFLTSLQYTVEIMYSKQSAIDRVLFTSKKSN
jgi:hypothetical protein